MFEIETGACDMGGLELRDGDAVIQFGLGKKSSGSTCSRRFGLNTHTK